MAAYTKYSPVPTEDIKENPSHMASAFDYSSAFSYKSAFEYNSNESGKKRRNLGGSIMNCISTILTLGSYTFIALTFPITVWFCIKKLQQWERLIVFRLGHLRGALGPGYVFIIPWLDRHTRIDMRTKAFSVPPQQFISIDNGIVEMGCEVKYRISDVARMATSVTTPEHGLRSFGKTVLLNVLTKHTAKEMERDRLLIATAILKELNSRVLSWGIEIGQVELSTVNILKEPEPHNGLKPLLGALSNGAVNGMPNLNNFSPPPSATANKPQGNNSLMDFATMAKMSGLSGFQGFSVTQPDIKKLKSEPPGVAKVPKTKLGKALQGMLDRSIGTELSHGVYRFNVEGKDGGVFVLFVATGIKQIVEGDLPKLKPDVSVAVSREDLSAIFEGTLPPLQAYLSGRLTVQGNIQLLMGLESLRQATVVPDKDGVLIV